MPNLLMTVSTGIFSKFRYVCSGSLTDRLAGSQVGDEVADLLIVESFEEIGGHEGLAHGLEYADFFSLQRDVLAVEASEDDDVGVLVG